MKKEKWVFQMFDPEHFPHLINMLHANMETFEIKVVVIAGAVLPLFTHGHLRETIEELISLGVNFEICNNSMHILGLDGQEPPKGATVATNGGLQAIHAARKAGYEYYVVA